MNDAGIDPLSPLARKIIEAGSYRKLVVTGEKSPLARELLDNVTPHQLLAVPVKNEAAANAMLAGLWLWHDALHESHEIAQKSPDELHSTALNLHSKGSKAGLNVLSMESVENCNEHALRQLQEMTATLAFWHAIMHRREGDFSNAKYWYARCADHPILPSLNAQASAILNPLPADKSLLRLTASGWDANAFVDFVAQLHEQPGDSRHGDSRHGDSRHGVAVALQRLEWRVLFDHCARRAAGG